jgi:hypothetical protein
MNKQPIETAQDQDLRLSLQAMQRAAKRAREIAVQTGTNIVVSHHGVIEQISPETESTDAQVHEPTPPYGDKR